MQVECLHRHRERSGGTPPYCTTKKVEHGTAVPSLVYARSESHGQSSLGTRPEANPTFHFDAISSSDRWSFSQTRRVLEKAPVELSRFDRRVLFWAGALALAISAATVIAIVFLKPTELPCPSGINEPSRHKLHLHGPIGPDDGEPRAGPDDRCQPP